MRILFKKHSQHQTFEPNDSLSNHGHHDSQIQRDTRKEHLADNRALTFLFQSLFLELHRFSFTNLLSGYLSPTQLFLGDYYFHQLLFIFQEILTHDVIWTISYVVFNIVYNIISYINITEKNSRANTTFSSF